MIARNNQKRVLRLVARRNLSRLSCGAWRESIMSRRLVLEPLEDRRLLSIDFMRAVTFGAGSADNVWYADQLAGLTADSSGNVYATGALQVNNGYSDGFVSKYDSGGNLLWRKLMGGSSWDVARQSVVDAAGNVYVAGYYESNGSVGSLPLPTLGMENLLVAKFSPSGTPLWARGVGSSAGDAASGLVLDAQGNVYVGGGFRNTVDFGNSYVLSVPAGKEMAGVIWKLDGATGATDWAVKADNVDASWCYSIAKGPNGEIYVGGNRGGGPGFVSQYTAAGQIVWSHTFSLSSASPNALAVDASGAVYAGVTFQGTNGSNDARMYKLNSANGAELWYQSIAAGPNHDNLNSISLDPTGLVYVGGMSNTNGVYNPPTSNWIGWIDQLDPVNGVVLWAGTVGAVSGKTSDTRVAAVATNSSGNVYLGGWFDRTTDLDPTSGVHEIATSGGNDAYFVTLTAPLNHTPVVTTMGNQTANEGASTSFMLGSFTDSASAAGLAVGDLIVLDSKGSPSATANQIIKVNPVNGSQTLISKDGYMDAPQALAVDPWGRIVVADGVPSGNPSAPAQILLINPATGAQRVLSEGGMLKTPAGLTIDAAGNILVADPGYTTGGAKGAILRIDPLTGAQSVAVAGGFINGPTDVTLDAEGDMYVAIGVVKGGYNTVGVVKVDADGNQTLISGGSSSSWTGGIVVDASGTPFISEIYYYNAIFRIDPITGAQSILTQYNYFEDPWDLNIDLAGNLVVADGEWWGPGRIVKVNPSTGTQTSISYGGLLVDPMDIAVVRSPGESRWAVTVAWGDMTTSTFAVNSPGSLGALLHTYADNGTYTVNVTVTEYGDAGAPGTGSFQVAVNNVAPTATIGNNGPVDEASPVTVSLNGASDPSATDTTAGFHYSYATVAGGLATSYAAATDGTSKQFTFDNSGTYTIYGRIFDKDGGSTDYQTSATVVSANHPPVAVNDNYNVPEDGAIVVAASGVLGNDSDPDDDPLTVNVVPVSSPLHGVVSLNSNGSFAYAPFVDFHGTDSFVYQITDAHGGTSTGTVTINVLSAQQQIAGLTVSVQALVGPGLPLNAGEGNSLTTKLAGATSAFGKGDVNAGINKLQAVVNEVEAKIKSKKLTTAQAQPLIDAVDAAITSAQSGAANVRTRVFATLGKIGHSDDSWLTPLEQSMLDALVNDQLAKG